VRDFCFAEVKISQIRCVSNQTCKKVAEAGHNSCVKRVKRYFDVGTITAESNKFLVQCVADTLQNFMQCRRIA